MVLMMPKDENELRHMLKTGIEYNDGPIAVRYPRISGTGVPLDSVMKPIPIGTWETVQEGDSVAVLAVGPMVQLALEAAELLKSQGIRPRIVNARFIKPLDEAMLLELASKGMSIVTLEEGAELGGFGSAVLEFYSGRDIHGMNVKLMGIPDYYVEHGSVKEQRAETGLTAENVATQIKALMPAIRQRA
jgi:1-deoxy-D-xylulose-5-phosphate synthase